MADLSSITVANAPVSYRAFELTVGIDPSTPDGLQYVPYDRTYKGLPEYGGDLVVHLKANGSYEAINDAAPISGAVSSR